MTCSIYSAMRRVLNRCSDINKLNFLNTFWLNNICLFKLRARSFYACPCRSVCLSLEKNVKNCQKQPIWTTYENKSCRFSWVHQINILKPCVCQFVCSFVGKVANQCGSQGFLNHTYPELSVTRATLVFEEFPFI